MKKFSLAIIFLLSSITLSSFALHENKLISNTEANKDTVSGYFSGEVVAAGDITAVDVTANENSEGENEEGEASEQPQNNTNSNALTDYVLQSALQRYNVANKTVLYEDADYEDYEFDPEDWKLILINKSHSLPDDYEVPLGNIYGSWQCDKRVAPELLMMIRDARAAGAYIYIASPYRTSATQVALYNNKITKFMNTGMSYLESYKLAGQAVTIPGTSEHEAGLCVDFLSNDYKSLSEGFGDTVSGKWLAENAHYYGFILRYPKDKEYITTIEFEPWHFRYVGVEAATLMYNEGITLEEFWEIYLD